MKMTQRKRFLGYINRNEEIVVDKVTGRVFAKEKFDLFDWATNKEQEAYSKGVVFESTCDYRVNIAYYPFKDSKPGIAICNPMDKSRISIGRAIAYCRLTGEPIPKEIFD